MGFIDATVFIPYSRVRLQTNFIIIRGPIVMTSSYSSPLSISAFSASVTRPRSPALPSSVISFITLLTALNSSSRIIRSLFLKPTTVCTSAPSSANFLATGYAIAQPTPPPTMATFFMPSVSVARPRGPTKSERQSPSFICANFSVVAPTFWKMTVTVPASRS